MASPFECEVRFMIPSIDQFKKKLKELEAKKLYDYEFTDYYYINDLNNPWDLNKKNLRLREWKKPESKCEILFTELEMIDIDGLKFKRSVFEEGKLSLYQGTFEKCKKLLGSLSFIHWFTIEKKNGTVYKIIKNNFNTCHEFIPKLGWSGELEIRGEDLNKASRNLKEEMKILGLTINDVTSDSLSVIYTNKNGLISD